MAYVAACADTGADCDAVLRADTMEDLQQKLAVHGKEVHGMDLATMPEEQKQKLMSLIKQE